MNPPTLVIHGFLTNKITNLPIHLALRRHGLRTYNVPIPGWNTQDIAKSAEMLDQRVEEIRKKYNVDNVNLVGISMGGVIVAYYLRCAGGHSKLNRAVILGAPVNGTPVIEFAKKMPLLGVAARQMAKGSNIIEAINNADVTDADIISIYADGDSVVPPEAAKLKHGRNVKAPIGNWPLGHYQLVTDPRNLDFAAQELLR